jgi:hypothetical protein
MARSSKSYYIAPTAVSIVPNCNGTSSDLAVNITRGTRIKVYYPSILDLGMVGGSFQEWILSGRNRSLKRPDRPYTIYARLWKGGVPTRAASAASDSGYLVFAEQVKDDDDNWTDPYILSPNTSSTDPLNNITGADGNKYSWPPIPARQAEDGRTDYWWLKLGTVSLPDSNGERTVTLDTGILGTEEYNAQWRLNPDDLPDRPVRTVITDRGAWEETPHVVYRGQTGTRTPDGTLPAPLAAILGWEGTDPLTFTTGDPIAEPYHFESLTRHRFIAKRLDSENAALTDAELYEKLTTTSKGWEEENELETSRAWRGGILWECLIESTAEAPRWGCSDWKEVGGDQTIYCEILSSAGTTFRNGNVDTILTMSVRYAQEEIGPLIAYPKKTVTWKRMTGWDDTLKTFVETSADRSWTPVYTDGGRLGIVLQRSDMGSGWMTDYRRAQFVCIIDENGPEPMMAVRRIL